MTGMRLDIKEDVLFGLFLQTYLNCKDTKKIAIRKKQYGKWRKYTWQDYYHNAVWIGSGLLKLSLEHGDKVTIIGDNDPEWIFAEMGTLAIGGVAIGCHVDSTPTEIKYILNHSETRFIFAKDQEAVDKVLSIASEIPALKKIIYWDPKGLWSYEEQLLSSWEELIRLGQGMQRENPEFFQHAAERVKPDDLAFLMYTSGTTRLPKAAMYSHRIWINSIAAHRSYWEILPHYNEVVYVSPAWAAGQMYVSRHTTDGHTANFAENPGTVQENIKEIAPHVIFYTPRLWEDVISAINRRIGDSAPLNRLVYKYALKVGYKIADCHFNNVRPNLFWRAAYALCHVLVFRPLKDFFGLVRVKAAFTGGGTLGPDSFRFLTALGLNIRQVYGASELINIAAHRDRDVKFESVGKKTCEELTITEEGEIIARDKSLFIGYYKDQNLYQECVRDGWFHTGDAGHMDNDGHLIFWDRLSDLKQLKGGAKFSPLYIESRLRFSPYIRDAICVGGDREYIAVLVAIDFEDVGKWAERRKIAYTTFVDLSQRPEVLDLVKGEVQVVNDTLPEWSRVLKLVNLPKELDPDEAELTRTRKLRRGFVEERYREIIEAIYDGKEELSTQVKVQYRDGTEKLLKAKLKITSM